MKKSTKNIQLELFSGFQFKEWVITSVSGYWSYYRNAVVTEWGDPNRPNVAYYISGKRVHLPLIKMENWH
jgi:hypothetical protein